MSDSLYDKYGGYPTVAVVVAAFYDGIAQDPELMPAFENIDMPKLMDHQTRFLCKMLGGPVDHIGRSIMPDEARFKIDNVSLIHVAKLLQQVLEATGIEQRDIPAIMNIVIRGQPGAATVLSAA
jgi:hemoglobin